MRDTFLVKNDCINMRLDRWFRRYVGDVPQSLIEKNIRKGKIKINHKKEKSSYKLKKNDKIEIFDNNFLKFKNKSFKTKYIPNKKEANSISSFFIEDNDNFVVINKPAGIAVQSGTKSRRNIIDILRSTKEFSKSTPFTVHRIDKETSGLLIVSKNRSYAQLITSLFRLRKIHKSYLGIIIGELDKQKGTFTDELIYFEGDKKIKAKAITRYKVLDSNYNYSLLMLYPITGRKHQLRKQLLIRGTPILGDDKYRLINSNKNKKSNLMLHAYNIYFSIAGVKYNFFADPPQHFTKALKEKYLKIS